MAHRTDDARTADYKLDEIDGLISDIRDSINSLDDLAAEAKELTDYGVEAEELIDTHKQVNGWGGVEEVEGKLERLATLESSLKELVGVLTKLGLIKVEVSPKVGVGVVSIHTQPADDEVPF